MKKFVAMGVVSMVLVGSSICRAADKGGAAKFKTALAVIDGAKTVHSYRLDPNRSLDKKDADAKWIGDYAIASDGPNLNPEQVKQVRKIIHDTLVGSWRSQKGCDPMPGVGLRFVSDKHQVEIAVCYECKMWGFYLDGIRLGWEDFDSANSRLVKLAKALFPKDEAIQGL